MVTSRGSLLKVTLADSGNDSLVGERGRFKLVRPIKIVVWCNTNSVPSSLSKNTVLVFLAPRNLYHIVRAAKSDPSFVKNSE